jgi:hypothetical protein
LILPTLVTAFAVPNGWGTRQLQQQNVLAHRGRGGNLPLSASTTTTTTTSPPTEVISEANWNLLSDRGRKALQNLMEHDRSFRAQTHVYENWPDAGVDDEGKIRLTEQVRFQESGMEEE